MRTFALPLALALLGSAASAQCFDSNYGTPIGGSSLFGDVVLGIQPIGFAFPIGAATYTDVHICDKGYVFLSNAGTPAPGFADFTATATELASGPPRVCALWSDIQTLQSNAGEIYIKSTATDCTISWINAQCYSATSGLFNMQMVLSSNGSVKVLFGPGTTNNSTQPTWLVGVAGLSPGSTTAPAPSDLSAGGVSSGSTVVEEWLAANTFDMANNGLLYTPTGSGSYVFTPMGTPVNCASATKYGAGCVQLTDSFYEEWTSGFDLNGGTVSWLRSGAGYTVLTAIPGTFVTPSGGAINIAPGMLDSAQVVALSAPMSVPGGTTTSLCVTTKGQIQVSSTLPPFIDFSPSVDELLDDTVTTFALWHDYNQTDPGSGLILFEEVAGTAYITWNGVHSYSSSSPSTFQFQFNLASGNVTLVIGSMGGFANPDNGILGYSVGGSSFDPGSTDLSALGGALVISDTFALGLTLDPQGSPSIGNSSFALVTSSVPNLVPVGIQFFGTGVINPGIDLTFLGMAGCSAYTNSDLTSLTFPVSLPAGTGSVGLPIPNNAGLIGLVLSTQSVCFTTATSLGLATSNGLQITIGN